MGLCSCDRKWCDGGRDDCRFFGYVTPDLPNRFCVHWRRGRNP